MLLPGCFKKAFKTEFQPQAPIIHLWACSLMSCWSYPTALPSLREPRHPNYPGKEMEAQRKEVTYPRSHRVWCFQLQHNTSNQSGDLRPLAGERQSSFSLAAGLGFPIWTTKPHLTAPFTVQVGDSARTLLTASDRMILHISSDFTWTKPNSFSQTSTHPGIPG